MHEMSIAMGLIQQVEAAAAAHDATAVETVEIEAGLLKQIVPEALQLAWEAVREGTVAEDAELTVIETAPAARCRECDCKFEPEIDNYLCPQCGRADVEITAGNDIVLTSLTCGADPGDAET